MLLADMLLHPDFNTRMQAVEKMQESEWLYRTLIETSPDPIIMYNLRGELLTANTQAARTYGLSSVDELLREVKTVFDFLTDDGKAFAEASFRRTLREGTPQRNEYLIRVWGGKTIAAEMHSSIVRTATGEPCAFISVVRDITERKRSEEEREKYIRELQQALPKIKTLSALLPICASCKKIRDDKGYWNQIEAYIKDHSDAEFSHAFVLIV